MSILYWMFVGILLTINFGGWGIFLTIGLMLAADFLRAFFLVREDLKVKDVKENNVLVTIEVVEHKGQNMFLDLT